LSAATEPTRVDDAELASLVSRGAAALALPLSESQVDRLVAYVRLIERWNGTYNLTAIRDPRDMIGQHILDCLAATAALVRRRGAGSGERLLDVGSGAGLPGIVIAIAAPGWEIACIDSVGKKVAFVTHAAGALGLKGVSAVHGRVEALARDRFDIVASRAFASLTDIVAATRHLLKERGTWMAMKGKTPEAELAQLNGLADELTFHVEPLQVPGLSAERCVVWIDSSREASARS
jgi:16S rRNA (guanine527-N7)-methyltransferase